ncbi:MAG: 1-(5-phosphoribosyl)-5-[(5-phosphoribosylamino)methylideneamino]imidazole-4-carboxamide isomerase [Phototrophicales bacterium]|nr:MAG: 1-(5-phosphoribosyl)-5-[(5-phosphoribosylamino)methylideneamino]imidazole-4-carboxamide isomerase [Phototrophicales bacterium]
MIVYPAIDIRDGRVVRLLYGNPDMESVYSDNPVAVAHEWKLRGAEWVHVVNLDGALGENETALDTLNDIANVGLKVQFGGGIRSIESIQQALDAGATRVVLGTLIINQPELAPQIIERFGAEAIIVALDAKDGKVTIHGWQATSIWTPAEIGRQFAQDGIKHALYTDVSKDGDLSGVNVEATAQLAQDTGLAVIASGGVSSLDDIRKLKASGQVAGVIIGRALYAKMFTLEEALKVAKE